MKAQFDSSTDNLSIQRYPGYNHQEYITLDNLDGAVFQDFDDSEEETFNEYHVNKNENGDYMLEYFTVEDEKDGPTLSDSCKINLN